MTTLNYNTKIVGLTGGVGSGKTTVAQYFKAFGIPIYIADAEAKALMNRSKVIKRQLISLFGEEAYIEEKLNRTFLASKIFNDKTLLLKMNAIIHPKVASHFKRWLKKQTTPYIIKESAIIFEHNLQSEYNYIITVTSDINLRINRVIKRDQTTKERVEAIMKNQITDAEKIKKSHFVITNNDLVSTKKQVQNIHAELLKLIS